MDKHFLDSTNEEIRKAYAAGYAAGAAKVLGQNAFKITNYCHTKEELVKFLYDMSFNNENTFYDQNGVEIKDANSQHELADAWYEANTRRFTNLWLATPKDYNREILKHVVSNFLKEHFSTAYYVYVEHTNTDILHYHAIVEDNENQIVTRQDELRQKFIFACQSNNLKIA